MNPFKKEQPNLDSMKVNSDLDPFIVTSQIWMLSKRTFRARSYQKDGFSQREQSELDPSKRTAKSRSHQREQ
jgi:hypothetical protein